MSPAPAKTSSDAIVDAAITLLDEGGVEAVTMAAVAERVGVRPPSLYKRVADRAALLATVGERVNEELGEELRSAHDADARDAEDRLRHLAAAFRRYAREHPHRYGLLYADLPMAARPPADAKAQAAEPVIDVTAEIVGEEHALEAARLLTSFAHGFVSLELAGAFRLRGDVERDFDFGLDRLLDGLERA